MVEPPVQPIRPSRKPGWILFATSVVAFVTGDDPLARCDDALPHGLRLTASTVPSAEWPAYRRDPALTGFSPLAGGLAEAPVVKWSFDLGGRPTPSEQAQLVDVNGDNREELLRVTADRIICQTVEGESLWQTPELLNPGIVQIRDFAGDGTRGLLISEDTGVEQRRYMVSGKSGRTVLLYPCRDAFGRYERVGKILPDVPGEQICAWWSGDPVTQFGGDGMRGVGFLWSFENGLEAPHQRFRAEEVGTIYAPLHLFADMNGDDHDDMVMISHEEMWVYDLNTGKKLMQSTWGPQIRTYWASTAAIRLRDDQRPSLLMINPMIPGVQRVTQDGQSATSRWKHVIGGVEDQYQSRVRIDRGAPDPFVDLNGDGAVEILVAVTNEHDDGKTYLSVYSSNDGRRLYDGPGQTVLTVDELDGRAPAEVLIREGANTLRICHWTGDTFTEIWHGEGVEPLIRPEPPEGQLSRAVGARSSGMNMPLDRHADQADAFLLRFADGVFACRLEQSALQRGKLIESKQLPGASPARSRDVNWDGQTLRVERDGAGQITYSTPQRQVYAADPPLVGRFGGGQAIIVREFAGSIVRIGADGQGRKVLNENSPTMAGASLSDLDGDGDYELLATTQDPDGRTAIVAIDASGRERLRIASPPTATEVMLGPTGRMGETGGRWFVARYAIPYENTRVTAYHGRTGHELWTRDYLGPEKTPATKFVLHLPTAVHDVDVDGSDDLIASSENWYEVISVADNRTVTPNRVITAAVTPHWGAYATPILADVMGNGRPLVFHNNAYALALLTEPDGTPVWHYGLRRDTTHGSKSGLADLDGDGTIEFVTTQRDGLLRAFDARPLDEKCPTCAANDPLTNANHGGHVRWLFQLPPPLSDISTMDLDGDGRVECLCGSGDGKLTALREVDGQCESLWSVVLGAAVGAPVLADLDGDMRAEILVTTQDGRLHCLSSR